MAESLNVIALISGGKDSFYSLLHCLQNEHKVVALGNLYPGPSNHGTADDAAQGEEEHDLNSFMYQTVGHTVIPLYEQALEIPLYRQQIVGTAVQTGTSYGHAAQQQEADISSPGSGVGKEGGDDEDETESLVPLLKRIIAAHPTANALSTGAILSTYQRTRIESVALRLGLTPLSYLWQYPILPPGTQSSLLSDMEAVGLDARIVKVASGGLDEAFLWANVANPATVRRIERAMGRFGVTGDGAVLGEGGEFETLVVDGPGSVFKGRIVVREEDRKVVREGGGAAWLKILEASVVTKEVTEVTQEHYRIPDLLETKFTKILEFLDSKEPNTNFPELEALKLESSSTSDLFAIPHYQRAQNDVLHWTVQEEANINETISDQASKLIDQIQHLLHQASLEPTSIISTVIILRSMSDFVAVNKIYGALFTQPNPPSRVTISCGSTLPPQTNIVIHLAVHSPTTPSPARKALHVQSRSYWAPANIGPYSQAISIPLRLTSEDSDRSWVVTIAGQIPLVPHTMTLPASSGTPSEANEEAEFKMQAVLSLQHLVRIGLQMNVQWFTHTVAYFPASPIPASSLAASTTAPNFLTTKHKAMLAAKAWSRLHNSRPTTNSSDSGSDSDESEAQDLWEQKHFASMHNHSTDVPEKQLPDWEIVNGGGRGTFLVPPFWAAEVEELPRAAGVEWAAGQGIVGERGSVKIYAHNTTDSFSIHQCVFANSVYSVVMIAHTLVACEVRDRLLQARELLSLESSISSNASWVDASVPGISGVEHSTGLVPCKSLWDGEGRRLAAVFVFEACYESKHGEEY